MAHTRKYGPTKLFLKRAWFVYHDDGGERDRDACLSDLAELYILKLSAEQAGHVLFLMDFPNKGSWQK